MPRINKPLAYASLLAVAANCFAPAAQAGTAGYVGNLFVTLTGAASDTNGEGLTMTGQQYQYRLDGANIQDRTLTPLELKATGVSWGLGTASPWAGATLTVDTPVLGSLATRFRNGDATRYRSDVQITSAGLDINAYDDSGSVYMPIHLNASTTVLGVQGNVGVGTATPLSKLNIAGDDSYNGGGGQLYINGATDANKQLRIGYDTTNNFGYIRPIQVGGAEMNLILNPIGGNVGIGTTTPFSKTTISKPGVSALTTSDGTNNAHLTVAGSDALVRLQLGTMNVAPYAGLIQATYDNGGTNNGVEPLLLNSLGGNVGIGYSTAPGNRLSVAGSGIVTQGNSNEYALGISQSGGFLGLGASDSGSFIQSFASKPLQINGLGNDTYMNVIGGNVGIGTTTPMGRLDVFGGSASHRIFKEVGAAQNDYAYNYLKLFKIPTGINWSQTSFDGKICAHRSNDIGVSACADIHVSRSYDSQISFSQTASQWGYAPFQLVKVTDGGDDWATLLYDTHAGAGIYVWTVDGSVYNGNAADVVSFQPLWTATYGAALHTALAYAARNTVITEGNVGIGAAGPTSRLDVRRTDDTDGDAVTFGSKNYFMGRLGEDPSSNKVYLANTYNSDNSFIDFRLKGTGPANSKMIIKGDGNVGVGTTSPTAKLHIGGTAGIDGLKFPDGTLQTTAGIQGVALVTSGAGMVVNGNSVNRVGGVDWDGQAYSKDGYSGGAYASFVASNVSAWYMVGLNTDPTADASYTSLDYAWYVANGTGLIYESAANPLSGLVVAPGDVLAITYDGNYVRYLQNGVVRRTVAASIAGPLYLDSSFVNGTATPPVTNVQFGPLTQGSQWLNNGSSIYYNGGNVGIGTNAPGTKFQVALTPNANAKLGTSAFGANGLSYMSFDTAATDNEVGVFGGAGIGSLSSGIGFARENAGNWGMQLRFYTKPTAITTTDQIAERMRITGDGNVGIGTTTPAGKLTVQGADLASFTNNAALGNIVNQGGSYTPGNTIAMDFKPASHNVPFARIGMTETNQGSYLQFGTSNNYGVGVTNTAMTIDYAGNVGIGAVAPGNTLEIIGTHGNGVLGLTRSDLGGNKSHALYGATGDWYIRSASNAGKVILQDTGGNVGVGTSAPGYKLEVSGNFSATEVYAGNWFRNKTAAIGLYNETTGRHFYSRDANNWVIAAGQGLQIRDTYEGNVKGSLYYDGSGFGMLSGDGNWRIRTNVGQQEFMGITYADDLRANVFYDRTNPGYYVVPRSTSNLVNVTAQNVKTTCIGACY